MLSSTSTHCRLQPMCRGWQRHINPLWEYFRVRYSLQGFTTVGANLTFQMRTQGRFLPDYALPVGIHSQENSGAGNQQNVNHIPEPVEHSAVLTNTKSQVPNTVQCTKGTLQARSATSRGGLLGYAEDLFIWKAENQGLGSQQPVKKPARKIKMLINKMN